MKFDKWSFKKSVSAWTLGLIVVVQAQILPVMADNDGTFQTGVRLYNSGRYASALNYFTAAERETSYDPRHSLLRRFVSSQVRTTVGCALFLSKVVDKYPDSDAAEMAKQGLGTMISAAVMTGPVAVYPNSTNCAWTLSPWKSLSIARSRAASRL